MIPAIVFAQRKPVGDKNKNPIADEITVDNVLPEYPSHYGKRELEWLSEWAYGIMLITYR